MYELAYNDRRAKKVSKNGVDLRTNDWDKPFYEGSDYGKVSGDRGDYTFHTRYEHNNLNLAHKVTATVGEQLNDPTFLMEWKVYEKWNEKAHEAYRLVTTSDIPRRICEQEAA